MKVYLDTSIFVAILLEDADWQTIRKWLARHSVEAAVSDFGWGECVSAIGLRVRRLALSPDTGAQLVSAASQMLREWERAFVSAADIADATTLITDFTLALRLPDAIHLAAARRLLLPILSTDEQQVRAARKIGMTAINPLDPDEMRS